MTLDSYFDSIVVINLATRRDRRREMEEELAKAKIRATFFEAVQVSEHEDWPSSGAKGCFLSHYTILKNSLASGSRNVLILEDDVDFSSHIEAFGTELVRQIEHDQWGFVYAGHEERPQKTAQDQLLLLDWIGGLKTTHFYAVHVSALPRLVHFLEQVMSRPNGHPLGGRQHVDGAYSMFRSQNPDVRTLIAWPVLGEQRSSYSDITRSQHDAIPFVRLFVRLARWIRRRVFR